MQADSQVAGAQEQRVVCSLQPQQPESHPPQIQALHTPPVGLSLRPLPRDQEQYPRQHLWPLLRLCVTTKIFHDLCRLSAAVSTSSMRMWAEACTSGPWCRDCIQPMAL